MVSLGSSLQGLQVNWFRLLVPGCGGLEGFVRSQNPRALVRNRVLGGASVLGTGFGDFRNSSINATLVLVNQAPVFSMVIYTHVYMWGCLMGMLLRETCFMSGGHIRTVRRRSRNCRAVCQT